MTCKCGVKIILNDKFCGECGSGVFIDENKVKKCPDPSCAVSVRTDVKFCTSCQHKFEDIVECKVGVTMENEPVKTLGRGLAIICVHGEFKDKNLNHGCAMIDANIMEKVWKNYGCETLVFQNETTSFYNEKLKIDNSTNTKLINEIDTKLGEINDLGFFVFVLSTHGHEAQEAAVSGELETHIRHYFLTYDSQYPTQNLMDQITGLFKLKGILKLFVIQACRSLSGPKDQCQDYGFDLDDFLKKESICPDSSEVPVIVMPPIQAVPHCDDGIVLFASMSGKQAYRTDNCDDGGGWLIKEIENVLKDHPKDTIYLFDFLTQVNREVGKRNAKNKDQVILKAQSCFVHNLIFHDEHLYLKKVSS